jgi:hypothetical protein
MKQLQSELTQEQTLLRAAWQILQKQDDSGYVLNILEQATVWDGAMCDGNCLMDEIGDLLFEQDVDTEFVGVDENE